MNKYKSLKIIYNQHISIRGWGLSVNAPATALLVLANNISKESFQNLQLKAFYNRVMLTSIKGLAETQKAYNKFKESAVNNPNPLKRAELATELGNRRKEFARKIEHSCDALIDKASRLQGEVVSVYNEMQKTEECKDEDDRSLKLKKLRAKKSEFLDHELEIHNASGLTNEELEERLDSTEELIDEFLQGNTRTMKEIKNDLKYIINRRIKFEEMSEDEFSKIEISGPRITQGIKLNSAGKVIK